jgi:hypothetical protein
MLYKAQDAATKTGAAIINKRVSINNNPFIVYFSSIILNIIVNKLKNI